MNSKIVKKKIVEEKRENNTFYYFIRWFILFYRVVCKNKNYDVEWVVKWIDKIDKVMFVSVDAMLVLLLQKSSSTGLFGYYLFCWKLKTL